MRGALPGQAVECIGYESWRWTIWGGIAYFIERMYREVRPPHSSSSLTSQIRARRETKIVGVLMHPSGAMEIRFDKPSFSYVAGQWLYLSVPEVSTFQWHPFTISSAPDDPYISVHVRQVGDFTRALGERLGCTAQLAQEVTGRADGKGEKKGYGEGEFVDYSSASIAAGLMSVLRIDGPYGAPAEDVFKHEGENYSPFSPGPARVRATTLIMSSRGACRHWHRRDPLCLDPQEHLVRPIPPLSSSALVGAAERSTGTCRRRASSGPSVASSSSGSIETRARSSGSRRSSSSSRTCVRLLVSFAGS